MKRKHASQTIVETEIADTLIGMPTSIQISGRQFRFYPPTLGVMLLTAKQLSGIGINEEVMRIRPSLEALRQVSENRRKVARIVATATARNKDEAQSETIMESRAKAFCSLDDEDLANLFLTAIQPPDISEIVKQSGIAREQELMGRAAKAKKDKCGAISFGALTVYGRLIDRACERYGWTLDYVVWGISYASLQLLIADSPQTVYITEKERREAGIPLDRSTIKADDKRNNAMIAEMFYKGKK